MSMLKRVTMNKVFATTVLGVALLFSQGANILVAALCPHLRSPSEPCITQTSDQDSTHEQMEHVDHMEMDSNDAESISEEPSPSNAHSENLTVEQPTGTCPHCAIHSRSSSNPVSFRESETAKRASDLNTPLVAEPLVLESQRTFPIFASRAHGPPGSELPRHVLINVFRI